MTTFGDVRSAVQAHDIGALVACSYDTKARKAISPPKEMADYIGDYLKRDERAALVYAWGNTIYQEMRKLQPLAPPGILMDYVGLWCKWVMVADLTEGCPYRIYHQPVPGNTRGGVIESSRCVGLAMWFCDKHKAWAANAAGYAPLWSIYKYRGGRDEVMPLAVYLYGEKIDLSAIDPLDYTYNRMYYGIVIPGRKNTSAAHKKKIEAAKPLAERQHQQPSLL